MENKKITILYNNYKKDFIRFIQSKFTLDRETISDIYHDSFIVLFENIKKGKLTSNDNLKSYLFRVGFNTTLNKFKREKKVIRNEIEFWYNDYDQIYDQKQDAVNKVIRGMDLKCKRILKLFYWERKSMVEIARELDYKNDKVAKNRKSMCFALLSKKLKEVFQIHGYE